jgi:pimeloyl-ACP methyl ester carboxylesterase
VERKNNQRLHPRISRRRRYTSGPTCRLARNSTSIHRSISTSRSTSSSICTELGESAPSANGYDVFTISTILQSFFEGEADEPYHLVGHDVGAWIAFAWAAQFPDEVKSLTLLDAALPGLAPPLPFPLRPELNTRLWQFSFNTLPELPEILTQGRGRELFDWLFDHKAVHPERIRRARRDHYVESYSRPDKMSNGFGYYRAAGLSALMNIDDFAKRELKMPILALGGKGGAAWSVFNSVEAHAADVRGDVIEDCGHYMMEEQPEEVARRLLRVF